MTEQQAVAPETDAGAKPPVEDSSAQDNLDTLLSEYDKPDQEQQTPKPTAQDDDIQSVVQWAKSQQEREIRDSTQRDLKAATELMKEAAGDVPVKIPDEVFEGVLYKRADNDPRIMKAWLNRAANPDGWSKVIRSLGKEIAKQFVPTDQKATESWDAVRSATHSASTSKAGSDAPNFSAMTDAEFQRWKMEHG